MRPDLTAKWASLNVCRSISKERLDVSTDDNLWPFGVTNDSYESLVQAYYAYHSNHIEVSFEQPCWYLLLATQWKFGCYCLRQKRCVRVRNQRSFLSVSRDTKQGPLRVMLVQVLVARRLVALIHVRWPTSSPPPRKSGGQNLLDAALQDRRIGGCAHEVNARARDGDEEINDEE
jgi:hypothetical protein